MTESDKAIEEMIKSFKFIAEKYLENTTKIYSVPVLAQNADGTYTVNFNGESHNLPLYGNNTITVGKPVKVFIPQGNMNLAFIM